MPETKKEFLSEFERQYIKYWIRIRKRTSDALDMTSRRKMSRLLYKLFTIIPIKRSISAWNWCFWGDNNFKSARLNPVSEILFSSLQKKGTDQWVSEWKWVSEWVSEWRGKLMTSQIRTTHYQSKNNRTTLLLNDIFITFQGDFFLLQICIDVDLSWRSFSICSMTKPPDCWK